MLKSMIATYIISYGGALVSLANPFVGFLLYVWLSMLQPELFFYEVKHPPVNGHFSLIVACAMLIGWVIRGLGDWNFGRAWPLVACIGGLQIWISLSAVTAGNQEIAWSFVIELGKCYLPWLVGLTLINSLKQLRQLMWVIVLTYAYMSYELSLAYFHGKNRLYLFGCAGMDNNFFALCLVTSIGLAFILGLYSKPWWIGVIPLGGSILCLHAVFFSFSRAGVLATIITTMMTFYLIRKKAIHWLLLACFIAIGFRLAGEQVRERFFTVFAKAEERDASANERIALWKSCRQVMVEHPMFGLGPMQWPLNAEKYGHPPLKEAHSLWFQWGAEMGIPGLAFMVLFYALCFIYMWPYARGKLGGGDVWNRHIACAVIASLTGFVIAGSFVTCSDVELPYFVGLLAAGVLKVSGNDRNPEPKPSKPGAHAFAGSNGHPFQGGPAAMAHG